VAKQTSLGQYLKEMRESKGLSVAELAARTGERSLTKGHISRIENDKGVPNFSTLQRLVTALDLPLILVLGGNSDASSSNTKNLAVLSDIENLTVFERKELVELLVYCQDLTDEQLEALLSVARSIKGFTKPLPNETQEEEE
jgi:transcriptional regulator with XRE-family HTH domain